MAEAVVNVVVQQLLLATTEWVKYEICLIKGVDDELQNMSTKMQTIQKLLDDAENKCMKDIIVKQWKISWMNGTLGLSN
ncbi:hypothetical protein LIER_38907 [Lithospermum erythrorhizon]|uniref:Disease resistance N-terminal domain-containing protein n=1 Tax=Lithospermum erythrorhizon TaxID=34254 RepID=A0AAV3Q7U5_LITER